MSKASNGWDRNPDIHAVRRFAFPSPTGAAPVPVPARIGAREMIPPVPRIANDSGDAPMVRITYPPQVEKLSVSTDFRANNYQVALGANAMVTPATWQFRLPTGQIGWLQQFAFYVLQPGVATSVAFSVQINGGPVPGWDNVLSPPGIANLIIIRDNDMRIPLPGGALVTVTATNQTANPETVGALIAGWYHPRAAEEQAWGPR